MQFQDKVALITGGNSGIGEATTHLMAERGATVAVLGRTESEINAVVQKIKDRGYAAIPVLADISEPEQLKAAIQGVVNHLGRLDIVFANAGVNGKWAPIDDLTVEDWDHTMDINLRGTFLTIKYAVPALRENGGSIVITASVNGTRMFSNSGATAYACTKAAQVVMAKMLALELAQDHIRVNVICPGAIESEIDDNTTREDLDSIRYPVEYPSGKVPLTKGDPGTAQDVAQLVAFLASDEAKHITGTEIWIDGAQSLFQG